MASLSPHSLGSLLAHCFNMAAAIFPAALLPQPQGRALPRRPPPWFRIPSLGRSASARTGASWAPPPPLSSFLLSWVLVSLSSWW